MNEYFIGNNLGTTWPQMVRIISGNFYSSALDNDLILRTTLFTRAQWSMEIVRGSVYMYVH